MFSMMGDTDKQMYEKLIKPRRLLVYPSFSYRRLFKFYGNNLTSNSSYNHRVFVCHVFNFFENWRKKNRELMCISNTFRQLYNFFSGFFRREFVLAKISEASNIGALNF